jgi:small GTP-binding protein
MDEKNLFKIVIVGDKGVGKTCLCISQSYKQFPEDYVPTAFDMWSSYYKSKDDNKEYSYFYSDTAGEDDYDKIRPLAYTSAEVFLICFSVVNFESFHRVKEKWIKK